MGAPQAADLPGQQPSPHLSGGGVFKRQPQGNHIGLPPLREWPNCPRDPPIGAMKNGAQSDTNNRVILPALGARN
jgi:hypothetical protein